MTQEALKLALEVLKKNVHELIAENKALKETLAQTQEPVSNDPLPRACNLAGVDYQTFLKIKAYMPVAPPQRTEQEPVACKALCGLCVKRGYTFCANAVKTTPIPTPPQRTWVGGGDLEDSNAYLTPPQRTWVGLTDEDCKGMSAGDKVVAMWADRTLKEKNT